MFRLTRQVRFYSPHGYLQLNITVAGNLSPTDAWLVNIQDIDSAVRTKVIDKLDWKDPAAATRQSLQLLQNTFPNFQIEQVSLDLSPHRHYTANISEPAMVCLSQKFEFCASHRLHDPRLSDDENARCFGKCNNPNGHGHNYELQVTTKGSTDIPALEKTVKESVLDRFDHKNLNVECPEFKTTIPSVENIARVIYELLKPRVNNLASVTVWETHKTWCEYAESAD